MIPKKYTISIYWAVLVFVIIFRINKYTNKRRLYLICKNAGIKRRLRKIYGCEMSN